MLFTKPETVVILHTTFLIIKESTMKKRTVQRRAVAKVYFKKAARAAIRDEIHYLAGRIAAGWDIIEDDITVLYRLCLRYRNAQRKLQEYSDVLANLDGEDV
jgi:hypothetical protein